MSRILFFIFLFSLPLYGVDKVLLKDGRGVKGEISEIRKDSIVMRVAMNARGAKVFSKRKYSFEVIDKIFFQPVAAEQSLLDSPNIVEIELWKELWNKKREILALPESNAGDVALGYVQLLLEKIRTGGNAKILGKQCLSLLEEVSKNDWNKERRVKAERQLPFVLLAMGEINEALALAEKLASETDNPEILIWAKHIQGEVRFKELQELVEGSPRWKDDPFLRPKHDALYHEVLNDFLMPYLLYGDRADDAARALWSAIEVYLHAEEKEAAQQRAEDIVALYPETTWRKKAEVLLGELETVEEKEEESLESTP